MYNITYFTYNITCIIQHWQQQKQQHIFMYKLSIFLILDNKVQVIKL
jgi:hypothetical protein